MSNSQISLDHPSSTNNDYQINRFVGILITWTGKKTKFLTIYIYLLLLSYCNSLSTTYTCVCDHKKYGIRKIEGRNHPPETLPSLNRVTLGHLMKEIPWPLAVQSAWRLEGMLFEEGLCDTRIRCHIFLTSWV